jgi:hypothetical protein
MSAYTGASRFARFVLRTALVTMSANKHVSFLQHCGEGNASNPQVGGSGLCLGYQQRDSRYKAALASAASYLESRYLESRYDAASWLPAARL